MQNKPRVLIAHYLPDAISGAERAIVDILAEMEREFDFTMLTPGEGALERFYREHKLNVWPRLVETVRRRYPGLHTYESYIFSRELREERIDLVVSNTFAAASRVGDAARMAKIPHAIYVREFVRPTRPHARTLQRADRILAVSNAVGEHIAQMVDPRKITLAYDLINAGPIEQRVKIHCQAGKRRLPFDDCCPVVGWVGRITTYKQPDLFVRAARAVHQQIPEARFVVIGGTSERDAEYGARVRSLARELGLEDVLHFLGDRADVIELISELDLLCVTSTYEPFPRVVLEAQVIGCPLVVSRSGGCPEMVSEGRTGLLFDALSDHAETSLVERILQMLGDEPLRKRLANAARAQLKETFAGRAPADDLSRIFHELIHIPQPQP